MEANQVIDRIVSDAKAEAEKINAAAAEKLALQKAKFDGELGEYKKQTALLAEKGAAERKSHIVAAARMDIAKEMLAEKRAILEEVFAEARKQMKQLGDAEYRQMMTKLMMEAVETGDEEVIVDTDEKRIDVEFIKQINRQLGAGYKGNLRAASEREKIGGGFILRRGRIRNNVSLDVMLDQSRLELEMKLAETLFSI